MLIETQEEAISTLDAAFASWAELSRGAWSQAFAQFQAISTEIASERRKRANRVSALEAKLAAEQTDPERAIIQQQVQRAQESLQSVNRSAARLAHSETTLRAAHHRTLESLDGDVPRSRADLRRRLTDLRAYRDGTIMPSGQATAPAGPFGSDEENLAVRGLRDVNLDEIDFADNPIVGVFGRGDTSLADYRWAVETWEVIVRPGIGQGLTREDFARRDADRDAQPLRRTADVHDLFLGDTDQLVVTRRADGKYDVVNGRHRIQVARLLGVRRLPARVLA